MKQQQEAILLSEFRKMTDDDREMLVDFAQACAEENPAIQLRKNPMLRLVEAPRTKQ